jgi:hypothetical protein
MSEQTFEDRVAMLEEHLVDDGAEELLDRAEQLVREGHLAHAKLVLWRAQLAREEELDELGEGDNDC